MMSRRLLAMPSMLMRAPTMATMATRSFSTAKLQFNKETEEVSNTLEHTKDVTPVEALSGAPIELSTNRIVRIYQQSKPATQSGTNGKFTEKKPYSTLIANYSVGTFAWRLDWDIVDRANRWENDLIGYASSGDYMQATQLKFDTKEAAIRFATKNGYDYYVQEPHKRDFRVKSYAVNFLHSPGKLKHIRTK